jgi:hypothetical protein
VSINPIIMFIIIYNSCFKFQNYAFCPQSALKYFIILIVKANFFLLDDFFGWSSNGEEIYFLRATKLICVLFSLCSHK